MLIRLLFACTFAKSNVETFHIAQPVKGFAKESFYPAIDDAGAATGEKNLKRLH